MSGMPGSCTHAHSLPPRVDKTHTSPMLDQHVHSNIQGVSRAERHLPSITTRISRFPNRESSILRKVFPMIPVLRLFTTPNWR